MLTVFALAVLRADHPAHLPEMEVATVEVDAHNVVVRLDDGTVLEFDRQELVAAVSEPAWLRRAA